jgi:hypothetical protein
LAPSTTASNAYKFERCVLNGIDVSGLSFTGLDRRRQHFYRVAVYRAALNSYQKLAADLVRLPVDVIVTYGAVIEALQATSSIPIVMALGVDPGTPIAAGFVPERGSARRQRHGVRRRRWHYQHQSRGVAQDHSWF